MSEDPLVSLIVASVLQVLVRCVVSVDQLEVEAKQEDRESKGLSNYRKLLTRKEYRISMNVKARMPPNIAFPTVVSGSSSDRCY